MKYLNLLIFFCLLLFSCKKEDIDNDGNQFDTRTGLYAVPDIAAVNYCVWVIDGDTILFQDTDNDSIAILSGKRMSFVGNFDYVTFEMHSKDPQKRYKSAGMNFSKRSYYLYEREDCDFVDTLVSKGQPQLQRHDITKPYVTLMIDEDTIPLSTSYRCDTTGRIEVLEISYLTNASGCKTLRAKGRMSNITFWNDICGPIPQYTISEGVFQFDFMIN